MGAEIWFCLIHHGLLPSSSLIPWSTRQWKACWLPAWQATNHIIHHKDCVTVHGSMKSWRFLFCVFVLCCEPICQTGGTSCTPLNCSCATKHVRQAGRQAGMPRTDYISLQTETVQIWWAWWWLLLALEAGSEQSAGRVFDFVHNHQSQFFLIFQNRREPSVALVISSPSKNCQFQLFQTPQKRELPVPVISKPLKEPPV
jgi:hypothetical protein